MNSITKWDWIMRTQEQKRKLLHRLKQSREALKKHNPEALRFYPLIGELDK